MQYISPKNIKVNTSDGMHCLSMQAGVPRELPDHLIAAAVVAGARPFVAAVPTPQGTTTNIETIATATEGQQTTEADAAVELIADVMAAIMAEGKPELLTSAGIPRANVIEERCGFNTSKEQRDEAWAIVEG